MWRLVLVLCALSLASAIDIPVNGSISLHHLDVDIQTSPDTSMQYSISFLVVTLQFQRPVSTRLFNGTYHYDTLAGALDGSMELTCEGSTFGVSTLNTSSMLDMTLPMSMINLHSASASAVPLVKLFRILTEEEDELDYHTLETVDQLLLRLLVIVSVKSTEYGADFSNFPSKLSHDGGLVRGCQVQFIPAHRQQTWPTRSIVDRRGIEATGMVPLNPLPGARYYHFDSLNWFSHLRTLTRAYLIESGLNQKLNRGPGSSHDGDYMNDVFLETRARGVPGLDGILNTVMKLVMTPLFTPVTDLLTADLTHSVSHNVGHSMDEHVPEDAAGMLIPPLTINVTNLMTDSVTLNLCEAVCRSITNVMGPYLVKEVRKELAPQLVDAVVAILNKAVSKKVSTVIPSLLERSAPICLTATLTRSLTHSMVPVLLQIMRGKADPNEELYCQLCYYQKQGCDKCSFSTQASYASSYYSTHFSDYFSNYYADYYTTVMKKLDKMRHPHGNVDLEASDQAQEPVQTDNAGGG
eukprot:GILJ01007902.1.p1 GENE.GILJ01007902.1~~GILJ01007902.1.p1  ORF type:complete len:523 (+),score=59.07 GILJ01007902.1:27-1595(+)